MESNGIEWTWTATAAPRLKSIYNFYLTIIPVFHLGTMTSLTPTLFQLHYRKHKYTPDKIEPALLFDIQNFTPIYSRFFDINESNYNSIQLNQQYYLQNIIEHSRQIINSDDNGGVDGGNTDTDRTRNQTLNHLETVIGDDAGNTHNAPIFVKYSPLLDPIRYLSGKYNIQDTKTMSLPKYNSSVDDCEEKMLNVNNASYVDGFFSYLTSKTLHTHGIVHGLDYYGSYLCKQREFSTNVFDDIEYLVGCSFFNNYENELFTIDYSQFGEDENELSDINASKLMKLRNKMKPLIGGGSGGGGADTGDYLNSNSRLHIIDPVFDEESVVDVGLMVDTEVCSPVGSECVIIDTPTVNAEMVELNVDELMNQDQPHGSDADIKPTLNKKDRTRDQDYSSDDSSDSSQSNSSYTTIDDDECDGGGDGGGGGDGRGDGHGEDSESDSESNDSEDSDSDGNKDTIKVDDTSFADDSDGSGSGSSDSGTYDSDDENITVKIKDFPVQAILLEKCVSTLDHIMMTDELTKEEWASILFQVIMTLIIYQKMFAFTHNDLHTNNVMFIETTEEFLYYLYEDQYYKVPTYGRIFKIIDFGRAIYKFRGELICSDSFHPKGDAATQYNFPPYYNAEKPTVEPNYSFDLCRFACALFDYFIYDLRKVEKLCKSDPVIRLIVKWTMDDKGRNVLYKSSGEERYPDFKLYKMITRSVHNHIPSTEIHNPIFDEYKITYKKYKKHAAMAAKFLKDGKNTHIMMNVDTLPCYVMEWN